MSLRSHTYSSIMKLNLKFTQIFGISVGSLVIVLVVLLLLNTGSGLRIRQVVIEGGFSEAEISSQQIVVRFNRPMAKQNWEELVTIEPEAEISFLERGTDLFIFFPKNIIANSEYTLSLSAEIKDIYEEPLGETETVNFTTRKLELYGQNLGEDETTISRWVLPEMEKSDLYSTDKSIRQYDVSSDFIAVVEEVKSEVYAVKLLNVNTRSEQWLTDTDSESAYAVQFVPARNLLYILKEKITYIDEYPVSDGGRSLFLYSLDTGASTKLSLNEQIRDVDEFKVSQDGRTILLRDSADAQYYVVDANNSANSLALGKFASTGGISPDNSKVAFSKLDLVGNTPEPFIVTVNEEKEETIISKVSAYSIDPYYASTTDQIIYSRRFEEIEGSRGLFEVFLLKSEDGIMTRLKESGLSLELPQLSPDDKFVVVESYMPEQLLDYANLRILGFQAKPNTSVAKIYSVADTGLVADLEDTINLKWR